MEQLFDGLVRLAHAVAPHLIHGAWLGLALAAVLAMFLRFSSWGSAAARYAFCWGTLLVIILLPAILALSENVTKGVTHGLMSRQVEQPAIPQPSRDVADASTIKIAELDRLRTIAYQRLAEERAALELPESPQPSPRAFIPYSDLNRELGYSPPVGAMSYGTVILVLIPPLLFGLVVLISLFLVVRLITALSRLVATIFVSEPAPVEIRERADYWAERLGCPRPISVRVSEAVQSPTATGYFKGIILLPPRVIEEFSRRDLEVVLIHEIGHITRGDDWARLGEYLLAALFFCLPAVHWLIRQIDLQREIACDDLVLSQTNRPHEYARTLTRLAEMSASARQIELAPGAMIIRKQIFARFTMILNGKKRHDSRPATRGLTVAFVGLATALLLVGSQLPAVALPGEAVTFADISEAIFDRPANIEEDFAAAAEEMRFFEDYQDPPVAWEEMHAKARAGAAAAASWQKAPTATAYAAGSGVVTVAPGAPLLALADLSAEGGPVMEAFEGAVKKVGTSLRDMGNWEGNIIDIDDDGRRGSYEYRKNGLWYKLEFDGTLELNDDLTGVMAIEPGGFLEIEERDHGDRTRVLVESDNAGQLTYTYYENGRETTFDDDGRVWFSETLATVIKASGIGAEQRVKRLREEKGVDAVLDEIELLPNGYARSRYYTALLQDPPLDTEESRKVFTHAGRWMDSDYSLAEFLIAAANDGKIDEVMMPDVVRALDEMDSDYELRRVLTAIGVGDNTDPELAVEVLTLAGQMDSDYERAELLIEMAPQVGEDDALLKAYVDAVIGLDSDYETRRVLTALGLGQRIDKKLAANVLPIASRMDSDYEKVELLLDLARVAKTDDELIQMYLDVASSVSSDYELRRALTELRPELGTSEAMLQRYIALADQISSDYDRSEFLIELAEFCENSPEMQSAYLRAADDISSDYDKSRVLKELFEVADDHPEFLGEVIQVVTAMSSDFEKANLLRELAPLCAQHKELEDSFVAAIESISGSYERDKLYREFYRELRRLQ